MKPISSRRYHQLDALRGIAALLVVLSHFAQLDSMQWVWHTPLRLLASGHEAVMLFFVLSGFALTLQLSGKRKLGYGEFILKRICRIYVPYIVCFFIAAICVDMAYSGPISWSPGWLSQMWPSPLSTSDYVNHIALIGSYDANKADPVIWSLIYEMRISLIFPLILAFVLRSSSVQALLFSILLSIASFFWMAYQGQNADLTEYSGGIAVTWHYVAIFAIGALLAVHRDSWMPWLRVGKRPYIGLAVSLVLYFLTRRGLYNEHGPIAAFLFDWLVAFGAAGIIAVALVSKRIGSFLMLKPIMFLGQISFSLYLTHLVVLLTVSHYLHSAGSGNRAMLLAAVLIVPIATAAYYLIERPAMTLAKNINRRKPPVDQPPLGTSA